MAKRYLNQLFDTELPILEALANHAAEHDGFIEDHIFTQACDEYKLDELDVQDQMYASDKYEFSRARRLDGWDVTLK